MPDNTLALYNALIDKKLYTKDYDSFVSQFSQESSRKNLYDGLVKENLYTKDYNSFVDQFFQKKKDGTGSSIGSGIGSDSSSVQPANDGTGWDDPVNFTGPGAVEKNKQFDQSGYSWSPGSTQGQIEKIKNSYLKQSPNTQSKARVDYAKEADEDAALLRIEQSRNGDYQSPANEIAFKNSTDKESLRNRLSNKSPVEKWLSTGDKQASERETEWVFSTIQAEQNDLRKALSSIDRDINRKFGYGIDEHFNNVDRLSELKIKMSASPQGNNKDFEEYENLLAKVEAFSGASEYEKRMQITAAIQANNYAAENYFKDTRFKDAQNIFKTQESAQVAMDALSDVLPGQYLAGHAVSQSLARLSAGIGTLMNIGENLTVGDKEYTKWDAMEDFFIGVTKDAEKYIPTPSNLARPLITNTANYSGYEIDIDKESNKILATRKNGKVIDVRWNEAQEKEILAAPRKEQTNVETLPYKAVGMISDLIIQIGLTKGAGSVIPSAIGATTKATLAVTASTVGMMAHPLYEEGLAIFNGDTVKASQYAIETAALIGVGSNMFGLEASMSGVGKGLLDDTFKKFAGKMPTPAKRAVSIIEAGSGEMLEETIMENAIKNIVGLSMNGKPDPYTMNEFVEDAILSFAVGAIVGSGAHNNNISSSAKLAAAKNPEGFKKAIIAEAEAGRVPGVNPEDETAIKDFAANKTAEVQKTAAAAEVIGGNQVAIVPLIESRADIIEKIEKAKALKMPASVAKYQAELDALDEQIEAQSLKSEETPGNNEQEEARMFQEELDLNNRRVIIGGNPGVLFVDAEGNHVVKLADGQELSLGDADSVNEMVDAGELRLLQNREVSISEDEETIAISNGETTETFAIVDKTQDETGAATSVTLRNNETGATVSTTSPDIISGIQKDKTNSSTEINTGEAIGAEPEELPVGSENASVVAPQQEPSDLKDKSKEPVKAFDVTEAIKALDLAIDEFGKAGFFRNGMSNEDFLATLKSLSFTKKMPGFVLSARNGVVEMNGAFGEAKFSVEDVAKEVRKKFGIGKEVKARTIKDVSRQLKAENAMDEIAIGFADGVRIQESDLNKYGDLNWVKDNPNIRARFLSRKKDGSATKVDQWAAQIADTWGIDESDAIQMIMDFVSRENVGSYLRGRVADQKNGQLSDPMFDQSDVEVMEELSDDQVKTIYERINESTDQILELLNEQEKDQLYNWLITHVDENGEFNAEEALTRLIDQEFAESFLGFSENLYKAITNAIEQIRSTEGYAKRSASESGSQIVAEANEEYKPAKTTKVKAIEALIEKKRAELTSAQRTLNAKSKELNQRSLADQENLFGERASAQGPLLFDERVDHSRIQAVLAPLSTAVDLAKTELTQLNKLLEEAKAESEMTLFDQGDATQQITKNGFPIGEKISKWIDRFIKQTFFSKGTLNDETFQLNQQRVASINATMEQVRQTKRRFNSAVKKVFGKKGPTKEQLEDISEALKNPSLMSGGVVTYRDGSAIEGPIIKVLREMRGQVNSLSGELVATGVAQGDLAIKILDNMDVYLNRAYRVHDDKGWIDTVQKLPVWNKAVAWIKSHQVDKIQAIQEMLDSYQFMLENADARIQKAIARQVNSDPGSKERDYAEKAEIKAKSAYRFWSQKIAETQKQIEVESQIFDNPEASLKAMLIEQQDNLSMAGVAKTGSLGSKNLGVFKQRKDIPKVVRDLFGEYNDPLANYAKSIFKQIHLLENAKFLRMVEKQGLNKFLFVVPQGDFTTRIAAPSTNTMSPLSGYYTTPELAEAFKSFNEPNDIPNWLYPMVWMSSVAKYAKTILSAVTHVRNFYFNQFFHIANGRMPGAGIYKEALEIIKADVDFLKGSPEAEARLRHLIELGVLGESVTFKEMMSLMEDVKAGWDAIGESSWGRKIKGPIRKGLDVAEQLYQAEDDFHKVVAFEVEKARYAKAVYGKKFNDLKASEKEVIEAKAALIVTQTMPTYSLIPKNIQELRRIPFVGTFVSFPYETIRTTKNTVSLAAEEIADPKTRNIGISRVLGMASATAGTIAISKLMHSFLGLDNDDEDHLRWFLPPWSENSIIIPVKRDGVNISYVDITSILPHGYIMSVLNSLFDKRKDTKQTGISLAETLFRPFFSQDMVFKRISEAYKNETESGKEIAATDDPANIRQRLIYAGEVFVPGTITTGQRLIKSMTNPELDYYGRLYPEIEAMTIVSGIRVSPVNIEGSFLFKAKGLAERARNDKQIYYRERGKQKYAELSPEEKKEALSEYRDRAVKAWQIMFYDAIQCYAAAIKLGADPEVLQKHLDKAGFNAKEIDLISKGEMSEPVFDDAPIRSRPPRKAR